MLAGLRRTRGHVLIGTYTHEYVQVTGGAPVDILLANRFRSGLTSSLRLSLNWDKRDNRLFPTSGLHAFVSASSTRRPSWAPRLRC